MSQEDKSALWQELKAAGVEFDQHYREYSTEELKRQVIQLRLEQGGAPGPDAEPEPEPMSVPDAEPEPEFRKAPAPPKIAPRPEIAGQRAYQDNEGETAIRTDSEGLTWFREEVRKPAYPKPRARRTLTYTDNGSKIETVVNGKYIESFEVAGEEKRTGVVKITMPSYQVGVYKDPRFPFKVHVYNDLRGFDLFEVQDFYGGGDLVPDEIKRLYIENDLCYDIRTTIRAINTEYRENQLKRSNDDRSR